jgi:ubiquinone/menaquinone biosynthesis C-methylase UbiE
MMQGSESFIVQNFRRRPHMNLLTRIGRISRSLLTLNRDREYQSLIQMLELKPSDHLLDVGSGDGFWTASFSTHSGRVTGLEPDEHMLSLARALYHRSNVEYVQGSAELIPYPNCTFDKVVSVSCLEHFSDPVQGLREMARVLKPGGRLAISVDSLLAENSPLSFREWHTRRHFVTHYFNREELLGMMKTVGFRCEPERTEHLFRSRLAARIRQVFIRHPRLLLPLFPLLYGIVRLSDRMMDDMHGQIIIVTAMQEKSRC